jgi:hypothetical protein
MFTRGKRLAMAKADKLICDVCGKKFNMPARLARHKAATHGVSTQIARKKGPKTTAHKPTNAPKKDAAALSPLREIVGDAVYDVWVAMLKELLPGGRTHRLTETAWAVSAASYNSGVSNLATLSPKARSLRRSSRATAARIGLTGNAASTFTPACFSFRRCATR